MTLAPRATGDALRSASGEVVRLWRVARASARLGVFPGLADGLVASLVERAGDALVEDGGDPAAVVAGAAGAVRVDPRSRDGSAGELDAELAILGTVLETVCAAISAASRARAFLADVVAAARRAAPGMAAGRPPAGVLVVLALSGTAPARRSDEDGGG